eukprot:GHVL01013197.1.p1 GENE.GHVL01013197.1~~GHVL01013197.1.p1  ORF type:complete len:274 (+),score=3.53 GHVL01013197.1:313-1134(+)
MFRSLLALIMLPTIFSFSKSRDRTNLFKIPRKSVFPVLLTGISGAVRQMVVPIALMFTSATSAGIIQPSVPVFTAVLTVCLGLEKGTWMKFLSVAICVAGLIVASNISQAHVDFGFWLLLVVPVSKGFQVVGVKMALGNLNGLAIQLWQIIILVLFVTPISFIAEIGIYHDWSINRWWSSVMAISLLHWGAVIYSVVAIILVCWRIQIFGVSVLGSLAVALYQALQPVFTMILSSLILKVPIRNNQIIGGVIVTVGLVLYVTQEWKQVRVISL